MSIQLLLRKYMNESLYRKALFNLIEMPGDTLIISTGYINNSNSKANSMAISDIVEQIKNTVTTKLDILIVGGDNGSNYPLCFEDFCNELNKNIKPSKKYINVEFKRVLGDNWHGKVAIKLDRDNLNQENNNNYGALIGSSNCTPINILHSQYGWNKEMDVYIVDGAKIKKDMLISIDEKEYSINICKKEIGVLAKRFEYYLKKYDNDLCKIMKETIEKIRKDLEEYCKDELYEDLYDSMDKSIKKIKINYSECEDKNIKDKALHILQQCNEINNIFRIEKEIRISYSKLLDTSVGLSNSKEFNYIPDYFYKGTGDILDIIYDLNVDNVNLKDINSLYSSIKEKEKYFNDRCKNDVSENMKNVFKALDECKNTVKGIRKNLGSFKTIYNLNVDGSYTESILKGIYMQIGDVINNFTYDH